MYSYQTLASYDFYFAEQYPRNYAADIESMELVQLVAPSPENNCVGQYQLRITSVNPLVYTPYISPPLGTSAAINLTTAPVFYNHTNPAAKIAFPAGQLLLYLQSLTFPPRAADWRTVFTPDCVLFIYSGTPLPEPILPSDVGLVNADFIASGASTPRVFMQLSSGDSLTVNQEILSTFSPLAPPSSYVYRLQESTSFQVSSCGAPPVPPTSPITQECVDTPDPSSITQECVDTPDPSSITEGNDDA